MAESTTEEIMARYKPFEDMVPEQFRYTHDTIHTMQINVGYKCNLACKHCHLQCGPNRTEAMNHETMQACLDAWDIGDYASMDITGGAPEMHPEYEWFLNEVAKRGIKPMCRTNLTILLEQKYGKFAQIYADIDATIVASLPHFEKTSCDKVRGDGAFEKSIEAMKKLNALGYGTGKHAIMLVYNPAGAVLAPDQGQMEREYRKHLSGDFGVEFDTLIAICNNPSGRFAARLAKRGKLDKYMNRLTGAFNVAACEGMMCRDQISIDWEGKVYDCDFNQALGLELEDGKTIFDFAKEKPIKRHIVFGNHCYGCTAGAGSSCGGATA